MSLPQRIAILIPAFPGQTHSFFWREIEALERRHGVQSQIISTRLPPRPVQHDWVEKAQAMQLYPMTRAEVASAVARLPLALPKLVGDPEIRRLLRQGKIWALVLVALKLERVCRRLGLKHMHVHFCANFALIAALCHRISGIPYSLTLHGPIGDYGPEQPLKWRYARFVFVITETVASQIAALMPDMMSKVEVVPMGVNVDHFRPPVIPRTERPDPFVWFCCGRLDPVKGHDTLIRAAVLLQERLPDQPFVIRIAGEDKQGGTGYREDLEGMIAEAGLVGIVQLLGSVTENEVRSGLQAAAGFVLASRAEPLGVAYMEAMACGLPVIGTDGGGVRELIDPDRTGILVPPESPEALASAMIRLMKDANLRTALGSAARQHVEQRFLSHRSADALAAALAEGA